MSLQQEFFVHNEVLHDQKSSRASKEWIKRKLGKNLEADTRTMIEHSFTAVCSDMPQDIRIGDRFRFDLALEPDWSTVTTNDIENKINLDFCVLVLTIHTDNLELEILRQRAQCPDESFSKDANYKKTVDFGVLSHVPLQFGHLHTGLSYRVRLEIGLNISSKAGASQPVNICYDCGPVLHTPHIESSNPLGIEALPTYEEVMPR